MSKLKVGVLWLLILMLWGVSAAWGQQTPRYEKIQWYMWKVLEGGGTNFYCENIWVWLEKIKAGELDAENTYFVDVDDKSKPIEEIIHNIIRGWGSLWFDPDYYAPYGAWKYAEWTSCTSLIWILLKYNDVIREGDYEFVEQLYDAFIRDRDYSLGSENAQIHEMVGRYIWSQYQQDAMSQYSYDPPLTKHVFTFTWEGRTYHPGSAYYTYELSRDWIYHRMRSWVLYGNAELDSPNYTWVFIHTFITLYQFAEDPVMKQRAKMMVDFILLESVLDFSANQWGGAMGRTYESTTRWGVSRFYWDCFWHAIRPSHEPVYNILFSSYRLPDVIYDIGDLSDEPDNYFHINKEYNASIVYSPGTGKWNYVTKFYNLGGRLGSGWQLCVKSEDEGPNGRSVPFRMWINTKKSGEDVSHPVEYESYMITGEFGYQYKNAIFVRGQNLHYALGPNQWDEDVTIENWRFFKEGRTMVAVHIRYDDNDLGAGVMEVAIEGVDYQSFDEFKWAVLGNANLDYIFFTTSRGDVITYDLIQGLGDYSSIVKRVGETEFEPVWDFPFPRIETVDHHGNTIVRWEGPTTMVLSKHGQQMTYDFENWTVTTTEAPPDITPPAAPVGVTVERRE